MIIIKICKRCGIEKAENEFSKAARNKDGLSNWCKSCCSDYDRQYREMHKEEISQRTRARYAENREKILEKQRQHYSDNKDKYKQYRKENKDRIAMWQGEYRETHKEEAREYQRKRYQKHKEAIKEQRRAKLEQLHRLKTTCVKCGETRPYVIDLHHIAPDTKVFEPSQLLNASGARLASELEKCICLCRNCHAEFHYLHGNSPQNPVGDLQEYLGASPYDHVVKIKR